MKLVVALDTSVKDYYIMGSLEGERNALDRYYKTLINEILNQPAGQDVANRHYVTEELRANWSEKQEIIREKQALASDYLRLLKGIACDHSNLKNLFLDNRNKSGERITCDQTPGLESLFSSSEQLTPETIVLLIESYSKEVAMLNDKAEEIFNNH